MKTQVAFPKIFLGFTQILAVLAVAFLLFFIFGHLFGEEPQHFNNRVEILALLFFPIGVVIGLLIALKSPLYGGIVACASILIAILLMPGLIYVPLIMGLSVPGFLFLIYGLFLRQKQ